ncbi:MAG: hypothetical protein ABTQ32_18715 [Myxococcaceae bacterium]
MVSEDSGKQGVPTVQRLLKAAAQLAVPGLDTRLLDSRPLPSGDLSLNAIRGNAWKDKRTTPEKLGLIRTIANELAQGNFVVFHVDSDSTWSRRASSENRKKFDAVVRHLVIQWLMTPSPRSQTAKVYQPRSNEEATALVANLLVMHPCYSIESWLYQATDELKARCRAAHDDADHQSLIDSWAMDRTLLDEVVRPKDDALGACVKDRHNEALAQQFPAERVDAAKKSWHEFVELLRASRRFRDRLVSR